MAKRSAPAVWEYFTMFQDRPEIANTSAARKLKEDLRMTQMNKTHRKSHHQKLRNNRKIEDDFDFLGFVCVVFMLEPTPFWKSFLIFAFFLSGGVFIKLFVDSLSVLVRIDGPYPRRSTVVFGRGINHASPYVLLNDLKLVPKDLNISFSKLGEIEPAPYEYNVIIRGSHKDFGGMCAAISSVYANAKNPNHLHFHVFLHPQLIHLFRIAQNEIPNLVNVKRITVRTFDPSQFNQSFDISKLFLLDIFKEIEGNFVYIDPDVLVQGDITELWRLRLKDDEVALVPNECQGSQKRGVNLFWRFSSNLNFDNDEVKALNFDPDRCAFGSGLIFGNATRWRHENLTHLFHHWIAVDGRINVSSIVHSNSTGDLSDALLMIGLYDKVGYLPDDWSVVFMGSKKFSKLLPRHLSKYKVLQWKGSKKPWNTENVLNTLWFKYGFDGIKASPQDQEDMF